MIQRVREAKGFGGLAHKANPDLWRKEKSAWRRTVVENYRDSKLNEQIMPNTNRQ